MAQATSRVWSSSGARELADEQERAVPAPPLQTFNPQNMRRKTHPDTRSHFIELGGLIKFTMPQLSLDVLEYRQVAHQQAKPPKHDARPAHTPDAAQDS